MIFEALAQHGDRPAIERADGTTVTYTELLARARQHVASSVVEVPAERSVDFIACCLGAWLGGGAFVPVDAADPRPRPPITHADGLAYAIATSGSTGTPKLVLVGHRGLPALWRTQIDAFALAPGARALWLHSPLFDASISDWGTALVSGATLVIPTRNAVANLSAELSKRLITHVDLPPSLLAHLDPPPGLRVVVLGGEACDVERVRALARRVRVVVVYGPTEATVCSSLVVVDPERWERPLIGHPLPGITYRVIDDELLIGGDALAFGYTDPDETARRFVEHGGMRMYRTGDRVVSTPQGLAFAGRVDRQCKVAGRRIELDEIEVALRRFASEAAVIVHAERIVAFVDRQVDRAALCAVLPAWMVPARMIVKRLPRTATGKIDRAALVVPPPAPTHSARALALAWCRALGVDDVRDDHRFSELGGDSLARLMLSIELGETIEGDPTFGELVTSERTSRTYTVRDCERRGLAMLDRPRSPAPRRTAGDVLITGATGFLGRMLVHAWQRRYPERRIVALVRRATDLDCELVSGDLTRPQLGLSDAAYQALRRRITTIVHGAATIQLGAGWEAHEGANVRGTAEIARFAGDDIPWHHISTLSVFVGTDGVNGRHEETAAPVADALAYGGYAQTKIAAEAIARACGASIYRLGLLVDETRTRDQLPMTLRALAKLGAAPAEYRERRYDETPVRYAAEAIAALASEPAGTYHIAAGSTRFGDVIDRMKLVELPHAVWLERARARADDPDIAMAIGAFSHRRELDLFLATNADFAVERTAERLRAIGVVP